MSVQVTPDEFRKLENRFIFQGGSEFGNSIADTIGRLTAERDELKRIASEHRDGRLAALEQLAECEALCKQCLEALKATEHIAIVCGFVPPKIVAEALAKVKR